MKQKTYYISFRVRVFPTAECRIYNGVTVAQDKKTAIALMAVHMTAEIPNYMIEKVVLAERAPEE